MGDEDVVIPSGTVHGVKVPVSETELTPAVQVDEEKMNEEKRCNRIQEPKLPSVEHLGSEDRKKFGDLLARHQDVFSQSEEDIGHYRGEHQLTITTTGSAPVRQRAYRTPLHLRELLQKKLDTLQEQGVIEESTSPWASPVVLIKKKDGAVRFCCDYRAVNAVIKHDSYPLPRIEDLIQATRNARFYSVLDQRSAYWSVPIDTQSREVTAFISEFGLKQWTRQPFGLKFSPGMFQRMMESVLEEFNRKTVLIYLDDVILFNESMEEHLELLDKVLTQFQQAGLKLRPDKCQVAVERVNFLGHPLDQTGIHPTEEKVEAIRNWRRPGNVKEVRQFLGLVGYYRQYIPHFSEKSAHLTDLLQKESQFLWTEDCEADFETLKKDLQKYPVLQYPDPADKFILTTDASNSGWGAELSQLTGVVAFASGKWTTTEINWSVTERELGAVVKATSKFHHYLVGKPFLLRTDHEAIKFMQKSKFPSGRLFRWIEQLQQYEYTVEHVPGKLIPHVDALSRRFEAETGKQQLRPTAPESVPKKRGDRDSGGADTSPHNGGGRT